MENKSTALTFFKRLLLLVTFAAVTVLLCYSCSAMSTVSNYRIDLKSVVGLVFEAENQQTVLVINSSEKAYINTTIEKVGGDYSLELRDNVLFLEKGEGDDAMRQIFVSISDKELFWQNRNEFLYRWEE